MTPTTALLMILTIALALHALGAPLSWQFREELKRAKKQTQNYVATGLVMALLGLVTLGLWWYYALHTDQILLGVIPTVSWACGRLMTALTKFSKKETGA